MPVLPTEPVTPITLPCVRARAATARSRKPASTSGTTRSGASAGKSLRRSAATTASACLGRERGGDKIVAVTVIAGDGEKRLARSDGAAVDREAGYRLRQCALPFGTHRLRHRVHGPQRGRAHAASSFKCRGDRLVIAERNRPGRR